MSQNRVIFTHNDFVILHQGGFIMHSGITYCAQNRRSIGEILKSLILIWEVLELEELKAFIVLLKCKSAIPFGTRRCSLLPCSRSVT